MKFIRLSDPLLSLLFENDDIVAVNKPYGIDSHTNDSKQGNEDYIVQGLIEIFESQLNCKLHIVHRLDRTTTGVIVFAKSLAAARIYQDFFRSRTTRKQYHFVTEKKSVTDVLSSNQEILHKGAHLEAKTDFSILRRGEKFDVWMAKPETGRNHQIRIHAAALGIPIYGDAKYGDGGFPFICLHCFEISFPNGVTIQSPAPKYFNELSLLENPKAIWAEFELDRRRRLFPKAIGSEQCLRLAQAARANAAGEKTIDQFGEFKFDNSEDSKAEAKVWIAQEGNIKYELRREDKNHVGLFIEQRLLRHWVRTNSQNKSVLNLFSFTGGFSVAAHLGGARQVTSVDHSKAVLAWARRNFNANAIDTESKESVDSERLKFFCRDSFTFLRQCRAKGSQFDLVICDPPAFSRLEKGVFRVESDLQALVESCLGILSFNGVLLISTFSEALRIDDIRRTIEAAALAMRVKEFKIDCVHPSLDCELPGERQAMKAFLIRLGPIEAE